MSRSTARLALEELIAKDRIEHVEARRNRASRHERLEHRERRRQATCLRDELADERLDRLAVRIDRRHGRLAGALVGAHVRLLVRHEVRRREEAVLEVVDAEARGLAIGDGAEMAGELHAALVPFLERRFELVARDVHVRLERRRADVVPIVDQPARVVGVGELVYLREVESGSLEIRRGGVDPRTGARRRRRSTS